VGDWSRDGRRLFEEKCVKESCGVVGVVAPGRSVSHRCFDALYALQHRGQESAGMATFDGHAITVVKDNGLVFSVFDERTLLSLPGSFAIGHTRYATSGSANWTAAQPVYRQSGAAGFALGHNGNLTNIDALSERAGILPGMVLSDSDLVAELLAARIDSGDTLTQAMASVLPTLEGAYSLVLLEADAIHGVRDPYGFRPLCSRPPRHRGRARGLGVGLGDTGARRARGFVRSRSRAGRDDVVDGRLGQFAPVDGPGRG
jgi:amidophosphoribosyltransferase